MRRNTFWAKRRASPEAPGKKPNVLKERQFTARPDAQGECREEGEKGMPHEGDD